MTDRSLSDLKKSIAHAKKLGVNMFVAPDSSNRAWELEEIERKTEKKGTGSQALKHLIRTADKHGKVLYLNAAGRHGHQPELENYYAKHGFVKMTGRGTLPGDMYRPLGKSHMTENKEYPNKWWKNYEVDKSERKRKRDIAQRRNAHQVKKHLDDLATDEKAQRDIILTKMMNARKLKEDVPTNSMGASSSTQGPIQTFDPIMGEKDKRKKRLKDLWKRSLNR